MLTLLTFITGLTLYLTKVSATMINPSQAQLHLALRLAIEAHDPKHQLGLHARSPQVQTILSLIPRIYQEFPATKDVAIYSAEGYFQRARAALSEHQARELARRFSHCTQEERKESIERRGMAAYRQRQVRQRFFLSPTESPDKRCRQQADELWKLGLIQLDIERLDAQITATLHAAEARDMQALCLKLQLLSDWKKWLPDLKPEPYPRQHEYYEANIRAFDKPDAIRLHWGGQCLDIAKSDQQSMVSCSR